MPGGRRKRPAGRRYTFACRACRITLHDRVEYAWCPRCGAEVDWIDGRFRVLTCAPCDLLVNKRVTDDACPNCAAPLTLISGPLGPEQPAGERQPLMAMTRRVGLAALVVQAIFAVLDPEAFPYLGPLLVFVQLGAFAIVSGLIATSREIRALAGEHATRVIHGFEHAAMNVLEERGIAMLGGQTMDGMFTITFEHDGTSYEHLETTVRDATTDAISRIRFGEHTLAYDRRCGTSYLVGVALLALAIVGAGVAATIAGVPSGLTFAVTVGAGFLARALARPAGLAAQRWLTVSHDFAAAVVTRVDKRVSSDGNTLTAIVMIDVIPKPRTSDVDAVAPSL